MKQVLIVLGALMLLALVVVEAYDRSGLFTVSASSEIVGDRFSVVVNDIGYRYYDFEATTRDEIWEIMLSEGPPVSGRDYTAIADTQYDIWTTSTILQQLDGCIIQQATVNLSAVYTYPRWITPVEQRDPWLNGEWERFLAHVVDHEEHHVEIATNCAEKLADELREYEVPLLCSEAEEDIQWMTNVSYAECMKQQTAFDAEHGHVTFPLP